jgi:chemotaxis signal transduction protein
LFNANKLAYGDCRSRRYKDQVIAIASLPEMAPLTSRSLSRCVCGVVNLCGAIVPIDDLRTHFGIGPRHDALT